MPNRMRWLAFTLCVGLTWLGPNVAWACGETPPSFNVLSTADGGVPAGTKVLKLYVYGVGAIDSVVATLELDRSTNSLPVTVPVTTRVLSSSLVEVDLGAASIESTGSYVLSVSLPPNVPTATQVQFHGVAAAPRPTSLGALALRSRESGSISLCCCGESAAGVQAVLDLMPSSAALPWMRAVKHQLFMDGRPLFEPEMPLVDYVGRPSPTTVRAIALCPGGATTTNKLFATAIDVQMPAAKHTITWTSTLPDGTVLTSDALELDLRCADTPMADAGAIDASMRSTDAAAGDAIAQDAGSVSAPGATTASAVSPSEAGASDEANDADGSARESAQDNSRAVRAGDSAPHSTGCSLQQRSTIQGSLALGCALLLSLRLRSRRRKR